MQFERRYQTCLHYHLTKSSLTCEQFQVLTTLDAKEVNDYFNYPTLSGKRLMHQLGTIVLYQSSKLNCSVENQQWLRQRQAMPKYLHLWSDCIGVDYIDKMEGLSEPQLGLSLFAIADRRQAIIWSLRLRISLFDSPFKVKSLERLRFVINLCLNNC